MAESNVKLRVDARDAVSALNQTNNASKQLNQTLNTTSRRAGTATANIQRFGISFRSVVGPMVALTGALTLANRSLNTFGKRQADLQVLAAQLERIGAGGSKQLDELKAAADRLGDATLFSQDDFIQSFNILSSFRAIAVESFTEVSEVAADIAQVMGSDVKSATVQLAKALEDPKRGLTALSRSGITFNEAQTETIKKLVDSGKLLDAQSLILETIKGQYEGAGTAAGKGFAGALDLLSENAGDAAEALGKVLEPAATDAANALAALLEQISKIPQPAADAALKIGLITTGVILLKKAADAFIGTKLAGVIGAQIAMYKAFGAKIYIAAAAQGALNTALGIGKALMIGLPFLAVAGGIIGIADALNQAINGQKDFNKLLKDGTLEMLENELATKKASLALQERFILQGRGEGRQADISKLNRLRDQVSELEAALIKKRAEKPKPKIKPGGGTVIDEDEQKRLAQIAAASADRVRSLEQQTLLASALNDEEKRQFERQIEIANLLENKAGLTDDQLRKELEATLNLYQQEDATRAIVAANELRKKKEKETNDAAKAALEAQQREAQRLQQLFGGIGQSISDGIVDGLTSAQSAAEALGNTLRNVGNQLLRLGINTGLKALFPGSSLFSGLLGFADGGRPPVGRPSIVGERGPELFVPDRAGTIIPNGAMGSTSIVVNVDASGSSVEGDADQAGQLGKMLGAAIQSELIKQKRPGGLLAT